MTRYGSFPWRVTKKQKNSCPYQTIYFRFVHTAQVYKKSPNNVSLGFRRQSCKRELGVPGLHEELDRNQQHMLNLGRCTTRRWRGVMWKAVQLLQSRLRVATAGKLKDQIGDVYDLSELPHNKKLLRQAAYKSLDNLGQLLDKLFMRTVRIKVKCPEFAKHGKYPRTIGDFTTEGSLLGGFVTPILKAIFAEPMEIDGALFVFVEKPDEEVIAEIFRQHMSTHRNVYTFHSDDNVVTLTWLDNGVIRRASFNLDISSCDISNAEKVFDFLLEIAKGDPLIYGIVSKLVEQCRQPCQVRNPYCPAEKFKLRASRAIEYSGSLLTTILNNCASLLISLRINYLFRRRTTLPADFGVFIAECAKSIGYIVTIDQWSTVHDSQFLKYSFDGVNVVYNLGPLLRGIGSCHGDIDKIPGQRRATISDKFERRCHNDITGCVAYGSNSVINSFRTRFKVPVYPNQNDEHLVHRYGLTHAEIESFCALILSIRPGMYINHSAAHKIMKKDYGYDPP